MIFLPGSLSAWGKGDSQLQRWPQETYAVWLWGNIHFCFQNHRIQGTTECQGRTLLLRESFHVLSFYIPWLWCLGFEEHPNLFRRSQLDTTEMRVIWQELQTVFIVETQRKWDSPGEHRWRDSQNTGQGGSQHVHCSAPGKCERPHKFASAPPSQES